LEFPKGKINYLAHFMECIWSCAVCWGHNSEEKRQGLPSWSL
jgi:hypothetical protein